MTVATLRIPTRGIFRVINVPPFQGSFHNVDETNQTKEVRTATQREHRNRHYEMTSIENTETNTAACRINIRTFHCSQANGNYVRLCVSGVLEFFFFRPKADFIIVFRFAAVL